MSEGENSSTLRLTMVDRDIANRGVTDPRVLAAFRKVPREVFVPVELAGEAYRDTPLPLHSGQTISQPYIVALMAEAAELSPSDRVLEVGAGSGYGAAILGQLAETVWSIERIESLAGDALTRLQELGYDNVHIICADGSAGLPEEGPFDAIVVTAAAATIPGALMDQLVDGGRLIIPVGATGSTQQLIRVRRRGHDFVREDLGPVRFVPLVAD